MGSFIPAFVSNAPSQVVGPGPGFVAPTGFSSEPSFDPQWLFSLLAALGQALAQMSGGWNNLLTNPPVPTATPSAPEPQPISFGGPQVAPFGFGSAGNAGPAGSSYAASSDAAVTSHYATPASVYASPPPEPAPQAAVSVAVAPPPAAAGGAGAYG